MYEWRKMTPEERRRAVAVRRRDREPWHSPPHFESDGEGHYLVTAACFEHAPINGGSPERLAACEQAILDLCRSHATDVAAWCILPNHYHLLVCTPSIRNLVAVLGRFHGRSSHQWNGQDAMRGRQVWYRCNDRAIRSERHFWTSMNYVHHNPVRHGYVKQWQEWPFSSAASFLETVGRETAEEMWREYPLLDYGEGWDPI
jgi:putative transposase